MVSPERVCQDDDRVVTGVRFPPGELGEGDQERDTKKLFNPYSRSSELVFSHPNSEVQDHDYSW